MAHYKVRSELLAAGGIEIGRSGSTTFDTSGRLTTGSLNHNSGSMTISASGVAVGGGTKVTNLMFGSVIFAVPQITASGPVVEQTATVANLPNGAKVFLTTASNPAGVTSVICTQARVASASVISASFATADHSATGGACNITFNYLALS